MDTLNALLEDKNLLQQLKTEQEAQFQKMMEAYKDQFNHQVKAMAYEVQLMRSERLAQTQKLDACINDFIKLANSSLKQQELVNNKLIDLEKQFEQNKTLLAETTQQHIEQLNSEAQEVVTFINGKFRSNIMNGLESAKDAEHRVSELLQQPTALLQEVQVTQQQQQKLMQQLVSALETLETLVKTR
jgi:hypothetical protein